MSTNNIHISISAEEVLRFGPFIVTNSMITSLIVSIILVLMALKVYIVFKKPKKNPTGFQNFVELIIETVNKFVFNVVKDKKKAQKFTPLFLSTFIIIMINNWFGLIPGVGTIFVNRFAYPNNQTIVEQESQEKQNNHSTEKSAGVKAGVNEINKNLKPEEKHLEQPTHEENHDQDHKQSSSVMLLRAGTADLNSTLALALVSVISIQLMGYSFLGLSYFKKFINLSSPINAFIGVLEIISEFAKIMSFAFRLFGNIFAGEVLLTVISALVPLVGPIPFFFLELFVGFIQALVFSMLTLVFYDMSATNHSKH